MKAVRVIISILAWAYSALVVWNMVKSHKELKEIERQTAETTRKTNYHF